MSSEHEHSAEEFARRLVTLTPAATLTRDQVLYEAGRSAGRQEARPWRFAASVMTVGMISFLAYETWSNTTPSMAWRAPHIQPEQPPQGQVAQSTMQPAPTSRAPNSAESADYIRLRDLILERGVDAMPQTLAAAATPQKNESQPTNDGDSRTWWRLRIKQLGGASL